jgi:hypothetical protein
VYGPQELPLMSAHLGCIDVSVARYQPGVFVDQPRLAQYVGCRVFQLRKHTQNLLDLNRKSRGIEHGECKFGTV